MPLTAAKHMHQHYQLQIASKTNQNSSTLDKKYGPKVAALRGLTIQTCRKATASGGPKILNLGIQNCEDESIFFIM
jgi:hypothetical protein